MNTILETREIPLDQLVIGTAQVRTRDVGKDIDELAASIQKHGLLQPILVAPAEEDGKFEIITGQRRFLALKHLGRATIRASVLNTRVDDAEAKVKSITENLVRRDPNPKDYVDACTALYHKYGSVKAVAEELALKPATVNDYIKFDQLVPALKELVQSGGVNVKTALRAQEAARASVDGTVDESAAIKYAQSMAGLSGVQQQRVVQTVKEVPGRPVDEVIEAAKTGEKVVQILVTLSAPTHEALKRFSADERTNQDDAAAGLIEDGLSSKGLLQESD